MLGFDVTDVIWFCTLQPRALSWLPNYYLSGFHLPRLCCFPSACRDHRWSGASGALRISIDPESQNTSTPSATTI